MTERPTDRYVYPARPRRVSRAVTSGITWQSPDRVPGAVLSAAAQRELHEKLAAIRECQGRAMVSGRSYYLR